MKTSTLYRINAVLLLLFAAGHTLAFRETDPQWGVDGMIHSMRNIVFDVQGFRRTYWDFFTASGLTAGVFFLFTAVLTWQMGGLSGEALAALRVTRWALAFAYLAVAALSWMHLFAIPIGFASVIAVGLLVSAAMPVAKRVDGV